jgi:hypothetical protein
MNEIEILNTEIQGQKIKDMTAIGFLHWVSARINGANAFSSTTNELKTLLTNPPMSRKMPDAQKIEIIKKMVNMGIEIK